MGLNLIWLAVEGADRSSVLDRLGFAEAGDVSDEMHAEYSCAELPGGWLILTSTDRQFSLDEMLAATISENLVLSCEVYESALFSQLRAFQGGVPIWSVTHDPDKEDGGLVVEGTPPSQYEKIKDRLVAEQIAAADEPVNYMFDAPLELSESVCGYRGDRSSGVEWTVLRRKQSQARPHTTGREKTLLGAMKSELLPFLRTLGWSLESSRPNLAEPEEITRRIGPLYQSIWFDFLDGDEVYIFVLFWASDRKEPDSRYFVTGRVVDVVIQPPIWKRLSWKRLLDLSTPPHPTDPISEAIKGARRDILLADKFLKTGVADPGIRLDTAYNRGVWPL